MLAKPGAAGQSRFWPGGGRIKSASVHTQMTQFWVAVGMKARMDSPSS
jgi:hypothetical protein